MNFPTLPALGFLCAFFLLNGLLRTQGKEPSPISVSGVYPSLTMYNEEGECGTGAVVPWADRLWVITYGPHKPQGSSDKLYEITPDLKQIIRPESIGGDTLTCKEIGELRGPTFDPLDDDDLFN